MEKETPAAGGPEERGAPAAARSGLVYHGIFSQTASPAARALAEHAALQKDAPVIRVEVYRRDAVVRKEVIPRPPDWQPAKRGIITVYSDEAMRRGIFLAKNCDCDFWSMITLTYPKEFPSDGLRVKKHLKDFKQSYERRYRRRGLWFMEFQERGAPHFHILSEVDLEECGEMVCKRRKKRWGLDSYMTCVAEEEWLARRWYAIVGSGDAKHLSAGVSWEAVEKEEGALRYMATHGAKRKQKKVPAAYQNCGRFWGKIGQLKLEKVGQAMMDTAQVFDAYGADALSSRGRCKKWLYDGANKIALDEL